MRRVVCLFLPSWPTDRLHKSGVPADAPLLTAARVKSRRVVMAADARAAALGLCPGMAVAQAQAMVPGLSVMDADPDADAAALGRLAVWCLRRYSPLVSASPPDSIFLDVTGCTDLFGGEATMLGHMADRLTRSGFAVRIAIAGTPGAAHALAHHAPIHHAPIDHAPIDQVPIYQAPIYQVHGPITIAAPGDQAVADLPVAALRLPDETVQALRTLGFDTIGQLAAAPRAPLAKRLGARVLLRLDQIAGGMSEPIEPIAVPGLPRTRMGFPEPIATPDDLARATSMLAEILCEKLQQRGLGASRVDLVFRRVDGAALAIRVGMAAATRDPAHMTRLLTAQLETVDPGFGIEGMVLSAPLTSQLEARQGVSELCAPTRAPDLSGLIDMLINRLGADRVHRMGPVQSDVPERSVQAVPPLARAEGANWPDRLPRPPRLFTPPYPIEAVALLPDHAPVQFTWRRCPHRVRRADGPERVFGEWWKTASETWAVRDYFQVEDEAGQRFWLFRRGDGEQAATGDLQWFLHGMFG